MGGSVACSLLTPPPYMPQLKEKVVCSLENRERERRGGCDPLFLNCVFMSPLTVSVPQYFTMEAIVCFGEKAWVFCFNHLLKSYVWQGGGPAPPLLGDRLALCAIMLSLYLHLSSLPSLSFLECSFFFTTCLHVWSFLMVHLQLFRLFFQWDRLDGREFGAVEFCHVSPSGLIFVESKQSRSDPSLFASVPSNPSVPFPLQPPAALR